ncbi:MAG: ammonium transporter [Sandaracinaceae bacterium]|nr:ammonium transporter [Sandaracinaceae bacterium]
MQVNAGSTAFMIISMALVLLMTPGLALFYGGMVRKKNVLSSLMHSFFAIALVSVQWVLLGYSLAFGGDIGGFVGDLRHVGFAGVGLEAHGEIPHLLFAGYQGMFAIITPALISGAVAERVKFSSYAIFILLWSTLVYGPVAHWVWAEGGWLYQMGALDFAGGTVVHLTSGVSALVFVKFMGPRVGYGREKFIPHDIPMMVLGTGLLLFGWIGFNAGSALAANGTAALAAITTWIAAAAGGLSWACAEWVKHKKPSMLGTASGLVAGLVAITPGAGFVSPLAAITVGSLAGLVCYGAVLWKARGGYDDALDAFGVHGVGGLLGALLTGVFAQKALNPSGQDGLIAAGNFHQLGVQALGVLVAALYAAAVSAVLLLVLRSTLGLRVDEPSEREGLDTTQHGEEAYNS